MVVGVAVFPDHVAVPIDLLDEATLEPIPRGKAAPRFVPHPGEIEEVAVGQEVAIGARRMRQIPAVRDGAFEVDQVDVPGAAHRDVEDVTGAGAPPVEGGEAGAHDPAAGLLIDVGHGTKEGDRGLQGKDVSGWAAAQEGMGQRRGPSGALIL